MDFVAFGIILDDIVYPDGRTAMGVLSGGGVQAAFGMRLWAERVGLVAGVGRDLPEFVWNWFRESDIDTLGVRVADLPTPRAWQVMESDGRRTQVWRVPGPVVGAQLARTMERLPEGYRRARGFHLGIHPNEPDLDFARQLRALGGMVGFETFKPADRQPDSTSLRALLSTADTFSLNLLEARSLLGPGEPAELIVRLMEAGASVVALRLGEAGSIVHDQRAGRGARLPALPTTVVDPVGAGNAYCGAFLAGWAQTGDVVTAGLYGAVAASFLVEQVGVPRASDKVRAAAQERLAALKPLTEPFSIR